ncbi:hypothetical protein EJ08DRAFT_273234 [Tothia fuscella]|uniref:WSC domain-containing protein n=1 Tax=Tothia fuscella TaxID=1048955 RepID=A0A9P4TWP9_9PEZI|nr:hypothetical protein EJ08DRAFT_273234 [Tothia fuscella]
MFFTSTRVAAAAIWLLSVVVRADPVAQAIPTATYAGPRNALTYEGCFSSAEPMSDHGPWTFQSSGNCQPICLQLEMPVMGLVNGSNCYCGALLPVADSKVPDDQCSTPCQGIDTENCGGANLWSVYRTGLNKNKIPNLDPASATGSAGKTTRTSTTQGAADTHVVTVTPSAPAKSGGAGGGGKSSTVGIAVGVVVGIIAIAGLVLGVWFFLRHKRRRDAEEEYKRQAAVNQFVTGGKSHHSNSSMNDSRLEPDILQRRESNGSIADNQDYSRRILKVRNPDDF